MSYSPPAAAARRSSSPESNGGAHAVAADERKRKRMLSNRESARRSRMRKQQKLEELIGEASRLKNENAQMEAQINAYTQEFGKVDGENAVLRARLGDLAARLQSLNAVLEIFQVVSGEPVDIPEIPDPLLRPWQPPFASQPIPAATAGDMFQF